ncbi:MAG: phospholipase D-like domain-containing protein [Cyanobacteria bacterium P01_G01_bin.54]
MAKKKTKRKSTKRKTTRRKSSRKKGGLSSFLKSLKQTQQQLTRTLSVLITVVVIVLAGYYAVTGADPLGIFSKIAPSAGPTAVGSGGDWWQVYFTNPKAASDPNNLKGSIPEKLIDRINQAQRTIHIAAFEFNLTPVAEALIAAQERGVTVQWVTDDEHGLGADHEADHGQFALLQAAGIEVKDDDRSALMHNKFWIFDEQVVWTGSTNITVNGNFRNNNNVLVLESPAVAAIYEREFAELWRGEFGPTSPSTVAEQTATVEGTPIQILFAAEDEVASQLVPLLNNAQQSIHFMAFAFTHDALGTAIQDRFQAGVEVKGIFEVRGSETEYSELPQQFCAGMAVRQDGNPQTFHHKVFIVDNQTVVTGSFNFSDNADESNDENVVIITHRDIAAEYQKEFERRWQEATELDPAEINC